MSNIFSNKVLAKSFVNYIDLTRIYRDILKYRLTITRIASNILFLQ